ncbi:hypothetical protein BXT86_06715 [candidate division WOR-3 bacterium 4484_100]|uniref:Uncharacterized protein n=1 Tax=candidate division WOR-3 bacterium 4484_100 TaxID=1936077 RepID=A0A1V4QET7_UNCW3|nr:MAG: hypothetical protein BXT86_06715 [candidate division WOR-3 bacterium 4484_100]
MLTREITLAFAIVNGLLCIGQLYLYLRNRKSQEFLYAGLFFLSTTTTIFAQFHIELKPDMMWVIFWNKIEHIGIFSLVYTAPILATSITKKQLPINFRWTLKILTLIIFALIGLTNLIVTNEPRMSLGLVRAGAGLLYYPLIGLLIIVSIFFYIYMIVMAKRDEEAEVNYLPFLVGVGMCIFGGIIDAYNIITNKILIPGFPEPFIFGMFILAIGFAWTFLSRYAWVVGALTESRAEIEKLIKKSNKSFVEFVHLIAKTLDAKDHYTAGHALRVMAYAVKIANTLGLPQNQIELLKQAALLHDIGKIAIPDGILNKTSPLSPEEKEYIYQHPVVARQILSSVSDFRDILDIIYHHHERVDGKGYPNGRKREDIPLLARILAVADAYDAMRSERPYRRAKTKAEAIEELNRVKGSQLDEKIVDKFIEVIKT